MPNPESVVVLTLSIMKSLVNFNDANILNYDITKQYYIYFWTINRTAKNVFQHRTSNDLPQIRPAKTIVHRLGKPHL